MSQDNLTLQAYSWADFLDVFVWEDWDYATDPATVTPVNLTGYTFELLIGRTVNVADLTLSIGSGLTVDALVGKIASRITPSQLQTLVAISPRFFWRLVGTSAGGLKYAIASGPFAIASGFGPIPPGGNPPAPVNHLCRTPERLLSTRTPGPQGPPGGLGAGGSAYLHTQSSASSTWTINHNLGFKPAVELIDSGGAEFSAEIVHTTVNTAIVSLTAPTAGLARCN